MANEFQINDIILNIPPEQITINRRSLNYPFQALRTKSSIKLKSGYSQLDISCRAYFTSNLNGYEKLRNLVSQFRVTPFCYVENEYLRTNIMHGDNSRNMALALKDMTISKNSIEMTDAVEVIFYFSWFNYLPYTPDFIFKAEPFLASPVRDPSESKAWELMYLAEQQRSFIEENAPYKPVTKLGKDPTKLIITEFQSITRSKIPLFKRNMDALKNLRNYVDSSVDNANDNRDVIPGMYRSLQQSPDGQELLTRQEAKALVSELVGTGTSMFEDKLKRSKAPMRELSDLLNQKISPTGSSRFRSSFGDSSWKVSQLLDTPTKEKTVRFRGSPAQTNEQESDYQVVIEREQTLTINEDRGIAPLILTGISISFQNMLAVMPVKSYTFPTFQHIGSVDAIVTLSFVATNDVGLQQLSAFYNLIEEQTIANKQIPQGQRNVRIENDLVNMCGLKEFVTRDLASETLPRSPGYSTAVITLINNPITSVTREQLKEGELHINNKDLLNAVSGIITTNLAPIPNLLSLEENTIGAGKSLSLRKLSKISYGLKRKLPELDENGRPTVKSDRNKKVDLLTSDAVYLGKDISSFPPQVRKKVQDILNLYPSATLQGIKKAGLFGNEHEIVIDLESAYFTYKGSQDNKDFQFKQICIQYGKILGGLLSDIVDLIEDYETDKEDAQMLRLVQGLTTNNVYGINLIQDLLNKIINKKQQKISANNTVLTAGEAAKLLFLPTLIHEAGKEELQEKFSRVTERWRLALDKFLNNIVSTNAINLYQFDHVKQNILALRQQGSVTGYPDFPSQEVVDLIRDNKEWNTTLQDLLSKIQKKQETYLSKGIVTNAASLINPDFYFYNSLADTREGLISEAVIRQATDAIRLIHGDKRARAEKDWFRDVYEPQKLGKTKALQVRKNMEQEGFPEKIKNFIQGIQKTDPVFTISDLDDPTQREGLGCSIAERKEAKKPISLKSISSGERVKNTSSSWGGAERPEKSLEPVEYWSEARHQFGLDVLDVAGSSNRILRVINQLPDGPEFDWPVSSATRKITSRFSSKRRHPVKAEVKAHLGIDLGSVSGLGSKGNPVYAAADGDIIAISYSSTEKSKGKKLGGGGVEIRIKHSHNYTTVYMHLLWDEYVQVLSKAFYTIGNVKIKKGQRIGSVGSTGTSTAPHLHFEVHKDGKPIDPETIYAPDISKLTKVFIDADPQNKSLIHKSIEQFEKNLSTGQGFGMVRAYPTYRLYFIESDLNERKRFQFDDFFSYSSVIGIELVRSRKLAADLLTLELTNTSGVLDNRKFRNTLNPNKARTSTGEIAKEEDSIVSFMLRPGTQIQLALGYSNNIRDLEVVFNGVIVDVQFVEDDQKVNITCQSFGIQLVQNTHGDSKSFGGIFDPAGVTGDILEALMAAPELTHFGRWEWGEGGSLGDNIRGLLQTRWTFTPQPADDNIFAPTGRGLWAILDDAADYVMYQTTIWDTIQELTLRHPSMIAYPVPYEGEYESRMTMFFGCPDQLYFARDPTPLEKDASMVIKEIGQQSVADKNKKDADDIRSTTNKPNAQETSDAIEKTNTKNEKARQFWVNKTLRNFTLNTGIIKPFRNYHLLTSNQHIIYNNIKNSSHNTFNTVTIQYEDNGADVDRKRGQVIFDQVKTYTLRCDGSLPDESVREFFGRFPNCVGEEMAKRYSLSLLKHCLREGYKGSLVVIGNPSIKPYDICTIFDQYNDMYGPIEVEQVIHSFNQQTGFITEITPDMCVHVNEHTTMATQDAFGLIAENWLKERIGVEGIAIGSGLGVAAGLGLAAVIGGIPALAGIGITALIAAPMANMMFNESELALGLEPSANPAKLIGSFIFSKAITRTQLAHPMRYSPLVKGGQVLLGGLPKQLDITFIQSIRKSFKDGYRGARLLISDTFDKLNPNTWVGRTTGDFGQFVTKGLPGQDD